ncbi:MAG: hypothetical protein ABI629_09685 [bacterium]
MSERRESSLPLKRRWQVRRGAQRLVTLMAVLGGLLSAPVAGARTTPPNGAPSPTVLPRARVDGTADADVDCLDTSLVVVLDAVDTGTEQRRVDVVPNGHFVFDAVPDGDYVASVEADCPLSFYPPQHLTVAGGNVSLELAPDVCPPRLLLNPRRAAPGSRIEVSGRCYYVHSGGAARVYLDGGLIAEVRAGTIGDYHTAILLPDATVPGRHTIHATTATGTRIGSADFFIGNVGVCLGDCDGDGDVRINELLTAVNIALGAVDVASCFAARVAGDETVGINAVVGAVRSALNGCEGPNVTPTPGPG